MSSKKNRLIYYIKGVFPAQLISFDFFHFLAIFGFTIYEVIHPCWFSETSSH